MLKNYILFYPNTEYICFIKDVLNMLDDHHIKSLKIDSLKCGLALNLANVTIAHQLDENNNLSKEINELDQEFKKSLLGVYTIISGYLNHFDYVKVNSAIKLLSFFSDSFNKVFERGSFEEIKSIQEMLFKITNDENLSLDISNLGIYDWIVKLKDFISRLMRKCDERVTFVAANPATNILELRFETNREFEKIIKHIDAKVTLEDNQNYRLLLDQLTLLIKNYDQLVFNTFA